MLMYTADIWIFLRWTSVSSYSIKHLHHKAVTVTNPLGWEEKHLIYTHSNCQLSPVPLDSTMTWMAENVHRHRAEQLNPVLFRVHEPWYYPVNQPVFPPVQIRASVICDVSADHCSFLPFLTWLFFSQHKKPFEHFLYFHCSFIPN